MYRFKFLTGKRKILHRQKHLNHTEELVIIQNNILFNKNLVSE